MSYTHTNSQHKFSVWLLHFIFLLSSSLLYLITLVPFPHFSSFIAFSLLIIWSIALVDHGHFIDDSVRMCVFRVRVWCQRVISHKIFDHVVLVFIFLNCITIALERPDIQANSPVRHTHGLCLNKTGFYSCCGAIHALLT